MKLIIAGSRNINLCFWFIDGLLQQFDLLGVTEVVSGGATGVDYSGESWALQAINQFGNYPKIKKFEADWENNGKAAGPIRNKQMAEYADRLLLIWDGESKGSASMRREMQKLNKPIYEVILKIP